MFSSLCFHNAECPNHVVRQNDNEYAKRVKSTLFVNGSLYSIDILKHKRRKVVNHPLFCGQFDGRWQHSINLLPKALLMCGLNKLAN